MGPLWPCQPGAAAAPSGAASSAVELSGLASGTATLAWVARGLYPFSGRFMRAATIDVKLFTEQLCCWTSRGAAVCWCGGSAGMKTE